MCREAVDLLMNSWRPATVKAYDTYIKQWQNFVNTNRILCPSHIHVSNFLATLYKSGASHSTVNLARSAVSAYLNKNGLNAVGSHLMVCRLMTGVFQSRPSLPHYTETWDVDAVLDCLVEWPSLEKIDLKHLSLRTVMLLSLVSGQRGQSLHTLLVDDVKFRDDKCVIVYSSLLKQTRVGHHLSPLSLERFEEKRLCIVSHLTEYIRRTQALRQGSELFISFTKPHKHISRDTLSRWIKTVLETAGLDLSQFSAHSTRAASTSAAYCREVSVEKIMQAAGWSSKRTFSKFYCKPVDQERRGKSLAQSVLDKFVRKDC